MKSIEKSGKIDRSKLSEEFYLQALMETGFELEMLSPKELERIQFECLAILAKQTETYNKGNSSSIRVETAKEILSSIMYTLGVFLKTFPLADDALTALKNEKIEFLYRQGFGQISSMLRTAKLTHSAMILNLPETGNVFYNETVIDAIEGFFKLYNPALAAHKIHITADYPVYLPVKQQAGIEFILNYLQNISHENTFCLRFPPAAVHNLLNGYVENYEEMAINIYEPLLTTAAGCILSGKNPQLLNLTRTDVRRLESLFRGKNSRKISAVISGAFDKIQEMFSFQPGTAEYIKDSLTLISSTIEIALENRTPERVFVIQKTIKNSK